MADPASPPPAAGGLPCPQCRFVNAVNSVYCQDCGAKLPVAPPSYLSPPAPAVPAPSPASATPAAAPRKKPRIVSVNHRREVAGAFLGVTVRTIIYAAFIAGVIQLFRAPRDLPAPVQPIDATVIEQVRAKFSDNAHRGISIEAPWERTNAYLAGVLMPANAEGTASTFVRALVRYRPDGFAFVTEKRVAGFVPVFTTIEYFVVARGSGLSLVPAGGAIGRVPIPAWAAGLLPFIGGDVTPALPFELDLLSGARNVQFSPASARIDFAPVQP